MNKSPSAAGWFLLGVVATLAVVAITRARQQPVVVVETRWHRLLKHPFTQAMLTLVAQVVASLIRLTPGFRFG